MALTTVVALLALIGGGSTVLVMRHRGAAPTVAAPPASPSPSSAAPTPDSTRSTDGGPSEPTTSASVTAPTATDAFPPPPTGPPVATVRTRSPLGALGKTLTGFGWDCVIQHDEPIVGACFSPTKDTDSVSWLGSGDRPDAVRLQADDGANGLDNAMTRLPATIGWSRADRDAVIAAVRAKKPRAALSWGTGYLWYQDNSTNSVGLQVDRRGVDVPDSPLEARAIDANLAAVESQALSHGYSCQRMESTPDDDRTTLECTGGGGTLTAWAVDDAAVQSLYAEGSERVIDDMLSLVAAVGDDGPGSDARAIASLVDSVREKDVGIVAGQGFMVICSTYGPHGCGVYSVDW